MPGKLKGAAKPQGGPQEADGGGAGPRVVGVPSGLLYYKYFPLWKSFLEELGAQVVESGKTTRAILSAGVSRAENESCLPVKVFYGHALALRDRVDALFIPRLVSVERHTHTCPKLLGLPDLVRAADQDMPPIISPTIDFHRSLWHNYRAVYGVGRLFTRNPLRILRAGAKAWLRHREYGRRLAEGWEPPAAMRGHVGSRLVEGRRLRIAVMGHHYNVFDTFTTMSLLERLKGMGVDIVTQDMVPDDWKEEELKKLPKQIYWNYERELAGALLACVSRRLVDGIIFVISFACGPDSMVHVLCEQERKRLGNLPMLTLVIDEHTGEAGLITRIEAFVDMLGRRCGTRAGERSGELVRA
jgi:predicted nucleotide-binding protein (sugar kinase/HSP70/actin superfamily)